MADLSVEIVKWARLRERIRPPRTVPGDPRSPDLIVVDPIDVDQRYPFVWKPSTDLGPS